MIARLPGTSNAPAAPCTPRAMASTVASGASPQATLAIWGLAYKENTHSVKNSPSLATIAQLPDAQLRVHDPVVPASAVRHAHVAGCADALDAARGADALLIMTPWPLYRDIAPAKVAEALAGRIVIDPYGVLNRDAAEAAGLAYYTLGRPGPSLRGSTPEASAKRAG